ncbi:efflux RND transporter periplasmic adaptor subunit [Exilibacterium tricleocarpae]|uniref:Efflux RND transporter periplasmic adaptor subunit n=1 Tax=Exilibacterium tricleocarpae TaxID=2591008 RepID=A0A545U5D8_9GAMM|nr:efflux RND transporter periplasmic adaptor subunit [Exilibacterium tricleocarpae]TQV84681.1 efflux RND transporter periplasmic adaptor subunit [Exilibacterium tricleocarpae]
MQTSGRSSATLSSRQRLQLTAGIVLAAVIYAVSTTPARAQTEPAAVQVQIDRVKEFSVQPKVKVAGTLHSRNRVAINAGIDGQLEWVAEPGTAIAQGQNIVKFNARPLALQLAEQQAIIKRNQVQLQYLGREAKRIEALRQNNNASLDELERIQSRRDLAAGDLAIARARVEQIKERLERTEIKAPFNGTVTERLHRGGEEVNRKDLIARFLDTDHLELRVFVPVKHFSQVAVGDTLTLSSGDTTYDGHNVVFEGKVRVIVPNADVRSQTFEVRIDVPVPATRHWTAGQLVETAIPLKYGKNALAVPRDALLLRRDGTYVVLIDNQNKAHRVKVTVGNAQDQWVSVSGRLAKGDRVAVRGAERLKEGDKVTVTEPAA